MYDVIVIGAGPTGAAAAKTLADKGRTVLLIEKCELPRYKSCSGCLIKKTMGLVQQYFGEEVPELTTCSPAENRGMVLVDDKGNHLTFGQPGLNVWRSSFDNWLTERAAAAGAEVRDRTGAVSCTEDDGIVTVVLQGRETYTEQARYVIDCEGVVGSFKRKLIKEKPQYITTFQTFNEGSIDLDHHYFYAYLQPELSEYDAWFNVKDDMLVLGVSVRNPARIEHFYRQFIAYMQDRHGLRIDRQVKAEKWLMPHIRPGCRVDHAVGRVLFAGEVAGFLNPMGEGISSGIESGHAAACAIAAHFDDRSAVLADYQAATRELQLYMQRQWSFVAGMADNFGEMRI